MPKNYKRKTLRQSWSQEAMAAALDAVKAGAKYKTASREFKVPLMALKRRAKGKNVHAVGHEKFLGGKATVFTLPQEMELVQHIQDMESRMYGLTIRDILTLAFQLAEKNELKHPFSIEKGRAGNDWLRGFRERHPEISLRSPESTSAARARAFNKPVVDKFFSILKNLQDTHLFPPHRIFNVDETSLSTVPTKNAKILAKTGRKQVARVTSAERGESTTAVICTSATGTFVPPMLIFRRERMKLELMDGAPPGSVYACNNSGWMKVDVFAKWFDHFLAHVKPSTEDPALLILDGHLSHTKNLNVILKARESSVTILCLPPHCTHKLQPLDVGIMYPLSVYHNQALESWMNNNPGRVVSVFQISRIFGESYLKASVPLNSINAFKKCGIVPFNPDVFSDDDFVAATTTEQPLELSRTPPSPSDAIHSPTTSSPSVLPYVTTTSVSPTVDISGEILSSSFSKATPKSINPLPKMIGPRNQTKRKSGGTAVLTSSPYKNQLEEDKKRKNEQELKQASRAKKRSKKLEVSQNAKKKRKGKGNGTSSGKGNKENKSKDQEQLEPTSVEEDAECMFCKHRYSQDKGGEEWIRCCVCLKWGHNECAAVDSDDIEEFTCDFCLSDRFRNVRKKLQL